MMYLYLNPQKVDFIPQAVPDFDFEFNPNDKFVCIRNESIKYRNFPISAVLANPLFPPMNIDNQKHGMKCYVFIDLFRRLVLYIPSRYLSLRLNYPNAPEIYFKEIEKEKKYPPILFSTANYDKLYAKYEQLKEDEKAKYKAKNEEETEIERNKREAQRDYDAKVRSDFRKELDELFEKYGLSLNSEYDLDEEAYTTYIMYRGFPVDELDSCRSY